MILRPEHIRLLRLGKPATPCNFGGGGGDSDSSTSTSSSTTNDVWSKDARNVASDNAVAVSGDNNVIDRSTSNLTQFTDNSKHDTLTSFVDNSIKDSSTKFTDNSYKDSSTKFTDNSDRSVTTMNSTVDYGSVNGALALAGSMSTKAFDTAGDIAKGAIDVLKQESKDNLSAVSMAFDNAKAQSALANASSAAVIGFASDALKASQSALQDAKDGGQSKMVMTAVMAAAAVGIAFALK